MMNEMVQAGIFFSGSAGGKGAARAQAAPGLRAEEPAHPAEGGFLAVFRETCQKGKSSPGRAQSHGAGEEETAEAQAIRKEGDVTGAFDPAWFFLLDSPDWATTVPDGTGPVDGSWLENGEHGSANPFQSGQVTAEATGEDFPGLAEIIVETEAPAETGLQTEPAMSTIPQATPAAAAGTEPVQEEGSRPAMVSGTTMPVIEGQLPSGAELTGEAAKEKASGIAQGVAENGEPGGTGNPSGSAKPSAAFSQPAVAEEAKTPPAAGRGRRGNNPHLAGETRIPVLSEEQLKVENEEQRPVFSVLKKANARTTAEKEEPEILAAGRLTADPVRADLLPVVEEPGVNQGERASVAEKVMNQILQGARLMVKNGVAHMHLELQPPELGKLQLALVVEGELVTARFTAESQTVQALIETNLPELRSALQEAGLQVDQLQVEVQTDAGSQNGSFGQFMPENSSSGPDGPEMDGLGMAFFSETGDEEGIREETLWPGRVNLRV